MEHQSFSDAWSEKAVLETLRQPTGPSVLWQRKPGDGSDICSHIRRRMRLRLQELPLWRSETSGGRVLH